MFPFPTFFLPVCVDSKMYLANITTCTNLYIFQYTWFAYNYFCPLWLATLLKKNAPITNEHKNICNNLVIVLVSWTINETPIPCQKCSTLSKYISKRVPVMIIHLKLKNLLSINYTSAIFNVTASPNLSYFI